MKFLFFLDSFPPSNNALLLDINVLRERERETQREREILKNQKLYLTV